MIAASGCSLGVLDRGSDSSSGDANASTVLVTISVPTASAATGLITASDVFAAEIDQVRIAVHRPNDDTDFVAKLLTDPDALGVYTLEVESPANTTLVAEAIGINNGSDDDSPDDDSVVAYGRRQFSVGLSSTFSLSLSMSRYTPTLLPQTTISSVTVPVAATQGRLLEADIEGYVSTDQWPADPDGDPLDTIDLVTSTFVDGASDATCCQLTTLHYIDAVEGRVAFSFPASVVPGVDATSISLQNEFRLIPGVTYERTEELDVMVPATELTASGGDNTVSLSWTNPAGSWFDGVKVLAAQTSAPQSHDEAGATVLYDGTGTAFSHSSLANGHTWNYAVIPYAENDGSYAYGPIASATATPVDTTAPTPCTGLAASVSSTTVSLSWLPSGDADKSQYVLKCKTSGYPTSYADSSATTVYSGGLATSVSHAASVSGTYYYALYVLDEVPNVSAPAYTYTTVTIATGNENITGPGYYYGSLSSSDSISVSSSSKYTDTWTFTLPYTATVTIGMDGYYGYPDFDTYLYLYRGETPSPSNRITYNDDSGYNGYGLNSRIVYTLSAGTYSVETTHYGSYRTGEYELWISW